MVKASPQRVSFNGGESSELMQGRVDLDRYPATMRECLNGIGVSQGPFISRSGTSFIAELYGTKSTIFLFEQSDVVRYEVEAAVGRFRFIGSDGLLARPAVAGAVVSVTTPFTFTAVGLGALVGEEVAIVGLAEYGMNGTVVYITAKVGDVYTTAFIPPVHVPVGATFSAKRVYHLAHDIPEADLDGLRTVQHNNTVYIFRQSGGIPKVLTRKSSFDWSIRDMDFVGGPTLPETEKRGILTAGGVAFPPVTATASGSGGGTSPSYAFDTDWNTYWESDVNQTGWLKADLGAAQAISGYVIYAPRANVSTTYAALDYAPGDWHVEGSNDDVAWTLIDTQRDFVLYENSRTPYIKMANTTAYRYYRLSINKCYRNGTVSPRVAIWWLLPAAGMTQNFLLSGDTSDTYDGGGFIASDVGLTIRVKDADGFYRTGKISTVYSAYFIEVRFMEDYVSTLNPTRNWSYSYWNVRQGYPTYGLFSDERLWCGGSPSHPGMLTGSRISAYEDFTQRSPLNEVLDDHAIVAVLPSKRVPTIRWMDTDERGIIVGTSKQEYVITPTSTQNTEGVITARNIKARSSTARGSAPIEPVKVDRQILYVQKTKRTLREIAYVFESDGYKSPSMSVYASHLGQSSFEQLAYTAEPHSIVWVRRADGSVVGFTYNRDERVIGWHRHDFGGVVERVVESITADGHQDTLAIAINRNGRRFYERMAPFWDFGHTLEDAHFVDCAVRYNGVEATVLYGFQHLIGRQLDGLIDGIPFPTLLTVAADGSLTLPFGGSDVIAGLPYVSRGEITNLEAGAVDGTAQGKLKRLTNYSLRVWDSAFGEAAVPMRNKPEDEQYEWQPLPYEEPGGVLGEVRLATEIVGPVTPPPGYTKEGTVAFRRTRPLPFNVIAIYPQVNTQDRG
mgnify:CR=1 FL=1